MTVTLFDFGKQYKDILNVNVVYLIKLVIFAFEEICLKI